MKCKMVTTPSGKDYVVFLVREDEPCPLFKVVKQVYLDVLHPSWSSHSKDPEVAVTETPRKKGFLSPRFSPSACLSEAIFPSMILLPPNLDRTRERWLGSWVFTGDLQSNKVEILKSLRTGHYVP